MSMDADGSFSSSSPSAAGGDIGEGAKLERFCISASSVKGSVSSETTAGGGVIESSSNPFVVVVVVDDEDEDDGVVKQDIRVFRMRSANRYRAYSLYFAYIFDLSFHHHPCGLDFPLTSGPRKHHCPGPF